MIVAETNHSSGLQPGDYTQWTGNNQNEPSQTRNVYTGIPLDLVDVQMILLMEFPSFAANVTAVYHNQYNSPMGIYSDSNVLQEFQNQTKGLIPESEQKRFMNNTATTSTFQNQNASPNYLQQLNQPSKQPRGTNSLSMHMLTKGIETAASTNGKNQVLQYSVQLQELISKISHLPFE